MLINCAIIKDVFIHSDTNLSDVLKLLPNSFTFDNLTLYNCNIFWSKFLANFYYHLTYYLQNIYHISIEFLNLHHTFLLSVLCIMYMAPPSWKIPSTQHPPGTTRVLMETSNKINFDRFKLPLRFAASTYFPKTKSSCVKLYILDRTE